MGFTPSTLGTFIGKNLGPTLHKSGYQSIALITPDDQRIFTLLVPWILSHKYEADKYVKGIGFHWYYKLIAPPDILTLLHHRYPDKFILSTEACEGLGAFRQHVALGSWHRAETYAQDIIEVIFTTIYTPESVYLKS